MIRVNSFVTQLQKVKDTAAKRKNNASVQYKTTKLKHIVR